MGVTIEDIIITIQRWLPVYCTVKNAISVLMIVGVMCYKYKK